MNNTLDVFLCAGDRIAVGSHITIAHDTDHFINIAFTVNSCTTTHDAYLIAGELVILVTDCCADTVSAFILDSPEPEDVDFLFSVYDTNISIVQFG